MPDPDLAPAAPAVEPAKRPARRSRKRLLLLAVLSCLVLSSLVVWSYYLNTRRPITKILPPPVVAAAVLQPRYLFSIYGVDQPVGVAVSPQGDRIYVAESGGERLLHAFDRDGNELGNFAAPRDQGTLRTPVYLAVHASGALYVTDRARRTVDLFDGGGNYKASFRSPYAEGWAPLGVRLFGDEVLVTDVTDKKHRVLRLGPDGGVIGEFGREGRGDSPDDLWFPNAAVADKRGRVYVADSNNGRVQVFDNGGAPLYTITGLGLPRGLVIDADQRLYVVDVVSHEVKVYDVSKEKAELMFGFGDFGTEDGQFNFPNDIAMDNGERLYIADRANNRVQVWVN